MGVYLTNADSVVDIWLINNAAEKPSPICLLQSLDPVHGILTAKEHTELGLLRQPLVESVDDTVDGALAERLPTFLKQAQVISRDVETDEQRLRVEQRYRLRHVVPLGRQEYEGGMTSEGSRRS